MEEVEKLIEKFERMAELHACKSSERKILKGADVEEHYSATISNKEASNPCFVHMAHKN